MNINEDEKIYIKYLRQAVLLLSMDEFKDFHFQINSNDEDYKNLANLISNEQISPQSYNKNIRPLAKRILEKVFTKEKVKELKEILNTLEKKYAEKLEIKKTVIACKLFLEDKDSKLNHFPLAIARLLEDSLKANFK